MAKGLETGKSTIASYYEHKTQLPSWNFDVSLSFAKQIAGGKGFQQFHVVDVSIPQYKMKPVTTMFGPIPYTFPTMETDSSGREVKITFEDDDRGRILRFIAGLQKTVISTGGYHKTPNQTRLGNIDITIRNNKNIPVAMYRAPNAFYLAADDISLNYSESAVLKYSVTFGCDMIQYSPM